MKLTLFLVFSMLALSFLTHVVIWRILRPTRYLVWLPLIFATVPAMVLVVGCDALAASGIFPSPEQFVAAAALYLVIALCYTGGYAGVVEYSPSAEILKVVSQHREGVRAEDLHVSSLSEAALTGKRVHHLLKNKLITTDGRTLRLTPFGAFVVAGCNTYRAIFNLREPAGG